METTYELTESIDIGATKEEVFNAMTDPEKVKEYFYGTNIETTWEIGSPITYRGEWNGQQYEDKGVVIDFKKNELIDTTYWSGMSGTEDVPENYQRVIYTFSDRDGKTRVIVNQSNIKSQESKDSSQEGWRQILTGLKNFCESNNG